MSELRPLTEAETTELLDWVSACQSSYHIDSTPGHRFGGLGSNLQENRESLVEYVNELIAARAQPQQAEAVPSDVVRDAERWLWMWNHAQNVSFSYSSRPYEITTVTKLHCGSLKDTIDAAIAQQKGQP